MNFRVRRQRHGRSDSRGERVTESMGGECGILSPRRDTSSAGHGPQPRTTQPREEGTPDEHIR